MSPNAIDRQLIDGDIIARGTTTGSIEHVANHLRRLEEAGATAILYQPAGSDIPRELAAFKKAADLRHHLAGTPVTAASA